jgi:hypothetical protein
VLPTPLRGLDRKGPAREQHTTSIRRRSRGHFVEAERLVEALPLTSERGEWDHQVRLATIHPLLAIAATLLEPAS